MNISRAYNFSDLSRITKLNTREFPELPIAKNLVCIEYQHFRDVICNVLGEM